ncbi:DUF2550 domain-containing protein [Nocardioides sp. WL0053]|jgi:hypothetical protein|uniref:DUF2550 domain-containing protein n=1 Tax=Nocardioides jiangsuensis TaxID=2866161 RepID=A0ABS7RKS4_9ACTN|nr:DUF2550 domain-containing protein [Nocardioides jiangsuensis]MBY9075645.1 DUF2550 domain-containing protein [Nocardioides jiangsuensis]
MPLWQWLLDAAGVVLLLVLLYGLALVFRRRWISRDGGTFEFSVRVRSTRAGRGWVLGVGRYSGDALEWFRIFSLAPGPKVVLRRSELEYVGRRDAEGAEAYSLYSGHIIVECLTPTGPLEVAMSPSALTGFLAWLEAAPPGQRLRRR